MFIGIEIVYVLQAKQNHFVAKTTLQFCKWGNVDWHVQILISSNIVKTKARYKLIEQMTLYGLQLTAVATEVTLSKIVAVL